jgi:FAD/FMN-containing dehydrogenase
MEPDDSPLSEGGGDLADDERCVRWVRDVRADVRPWSTGAVHLNFIGEEGTERVVAGLGAENTRRLAELKRRYDPDNVFRFNHDITSA